MIRGEGGGRHRAGEEETGEARITSLRLNDRNHMQTQRKSPNPEENMKISVDIRQLSPDKSTFFLFCLSDDALLTNIFRVTDVWMSRRSIMEPAVIG